MRGIMIRLAVSLSTSEVGTKMARLSDHLPHLLLYKLAGRVHWMANGPDF